MLKSLPQNGPTMEVRDNDKQSVMFKKGCQCCIHMIMLHITVILFYYNFHYFPFLIIAFDVHTL